MKKKIIVLALCVLMISGCGSKIPKLSNGDEAVVTLKDDSKISVNELYGKLKNDYALQTLINMIDRNILESKYPNELENAKNSADSTLQQLEAAYGDDLNQAIQYYTGYQSVDAYKDSLYINYLQNLAIQEYAKKQIDEKEVEKYYKNEIVGDIKISHILITPEVTKEMTDAEKKTKEEEAKKTVNTIIAELKKAKKDTIETRFSELAKEYSKDSTTKDNGGSLGFINKGTLSSAYDEVIDTAYKLKDGQYSTSIIETELGYHVILRTESKEKDSLENVRDSILETLADEYLKANTVTNIKAMQELRKEYDMSIVDSELQEQYANYVQNLINTYTQQDEENKKKNESSK